MRRLKKTDMKENPPIADQRGGNRLEVEAAPESLAPHVSSFVHRDGRDVGGGVRILPELRTSIQIMTGDAYWIRGRAEGSDWGKAPRIGLWVPSVDWRLGYVSNHVRAFAVGLSPDVFRLLAGKPARATLGAILDLECAAPGLAAAIDPVADDSFTSWRARAERASIPLFVGWPRSPKPLDASLVILATAPYRAIERAAEVVGYSPRHFRRLFGGRFGASPKTWRRVLRVDRMLRQIHPAPWEEDDIVAEPIAFANQSHAIREFRALTGVTPAQYRRMQALGDLTLRSLGVEGVDPSE
jgi:AraC-like DNA-binding protein